MLWLVSSLENKRKSNGVCTGLNMDIDRPFWYSARTLVMRTSYPPRPCQSRGRLQEARLLTVDGDDDDPVYGPL